ncbi:MFS transporter [Nitrospirillum sp. BR 11164]|uniref:MFS transporter n=1 Tax=Nitrospirillum sp. BR 11164 TaxID=3104324 RepID=UPI002AFEED15|nr:MFS transporter [Nitrospirillum sp. BR 11164]MEA1650817.1 MFS transporter [Nitrospirillum sp. BR 11164]
MSVNPRPDPAETPQPLAQPPAVSVFQLLSPKLLPATLMLGGGVTLFAVETYVTATVAPSVVRDIGGLELFAWVTTLYVAAAVLGSLFVALRPRSLGLRGVYTVGALVFSAGSLVCGLAPSMPVVLLGRTVQGLGAGMLSGLAYAFIRHAYPEPLWRKASTLYAAIWGVATFLGPTAGGLFAEGSAWRWAFFILLPPALLMAASAPRLLPRVADERADARTPLAQIGLLLAAVLLVSTAGTEERGDLKAGLLAGSLALFAAMLVVERRAPVRLLPQGAVLLGQPIARLYLIMFGLIVTVSSDVYIPYFLQTLHGVAPLASGYLVALVALGWTLTAFFTGTLSGGRAVLAISAGCALEAGATLALAPILGGSDPWDGPMTLLPAILAMLAMGGGVGLCWAHLVAGVLKRAGEAEQDKASAAIATMQSLGGALGAALSGVIANSAGLVDPGGIAGSQAAAHWLFLLMAAPGAIACLVSLVPNRT